MPGAALPVAVLAERVRLPRLHEVLGKADRLVENRPVTGELIRMHQSRTNHAQIVRPASILRSQDAVAAREVAESDAVASRHRDLSRSQGGDEFSGGCCVVSGWRICLGFLPR